ncbi:TetR/AcrR family transcriptional regulator [Xinfangfangia sp. CPCC 101601]|uniref:TetR/AcrR family transcriptional regulator n=1 Tax=Pseudogemmobacter lacusdianii TaxID=3069608 RepID=A0ABU0W1S8_9RHOB|nr:TetR/AcrR family transcriptional regulator [Xinfangfangia sp. CPCC 101601]MDQ2067919.1 TetR/AcrR family transcriptional regulator [Xinfangfangia sp. CPCC 101601]
MSSSIEGQAQDPLHQGRSTHEDWLNLALRTLIKDGIDRVKIQIMAKQLNVSRSSFYWYFKSPQDLYNQMLEHWLTKNTGPIIQRALRPSGSITEAILNVFECWVDEELFDPHLDVAVRLWARRAEPVLKVVEGADQQRLEAIKGMFLRHNFSEEDALVRARVLYFTQIGQYTLDVREDLTLRLSRTRAYLRAFGAENPNEDEVTRFESLVKSAMKTGNS